MQAAVFNGTALGEYVPLQLPKVERRDKKPRMHDTLPEKTRYQDDGCDISESCFSCPLPRCRYEERGGLRAIINAHRDNQMIQLRLAGMAVEDLADRFGVSRRTVFRVIGGRDREARPAKPNYEPTPIKRAVNAHKEEANCA
jgi:hypothetical protein